MAALRLYGAEQSPGTDKSKGQNILGGVGYILFRGPLKFEKVSFRVVFFMLFRMFFFWKIPSFETTKRLVYF